MKEIVDYVTNYEVTSDEAYSTARACLMDSLGCALLALQFPACKKLLGPAVPGTIVPNGARVPGTSYSLDPVRAAFNIGTLIRWLDYNDTWLAAEWGHPSDNLGGILAVADYMSRSRVATITVHDLLGAMIKAHEIQGILAQENSFNRIGFDHVILVKVATTAVVTKLFGGNPDQIFNAVSNAWIDVGPLRTYRHAPNTGSRKSWAAGDATSRGVFLAELALRGEMGYDQALTAPKWGLYDVLFQGKPFTLNRPFGTYVMENVLFKIAYPAEFHAQTAVEAAIALHPQVKDRLENISKIEIETHESALRIIDKKGPLKNPADRDHCLQYIVAVGLIYGTLTADHYEEKTSQDPRLDTLRNKMVLRENKNYSRDYLDPDKRSIANALTIHFQDGTTIHFAVEYPLGHKRRRVEGMPLLMKKFRDNAGSHFPKAKVEELCALFSDPSKLDPLKVCDFVDLWC